MKVDGLSGLIEGIGRPVDCHVAVDFISVRVDDTYEAGFDVFRILLIEPESETLKFKPIKADGLANSVKLIE